MDNNVLLKKHNSEDIFTTNFKKTVSLWQIIVIIIFSLCLLIMECTLDAFTYGLIVEPVTIEIYGPDADVIPDIQAYRISLRGGQIFIEPEPGILKWSETIRWFRGVYLTMPEKVYNDINKIIVKIGPEEFNYNKKKIREEWLEKITKETVTLMSPNDMKCGNSAVPAINKLINWPGDRNIFFKLLFPVKNFRNVNIMLILWYILWVFSLIGFGSLIDLLYSVKENRKTKITIYGITGFIILYFWGTIINFFIPINTSVSAIFLIIGIILFFINKSKIIQSLNKYDLLILLLLMFFFSLFPCTICRSGDTGLYHLQSVKWIRESPLPFGLTNLHSRLGYNSSWFTIAAFLFTPGSLIGEHYFIINSIMMFFYGSAISLTIKNLFSAQKKIFSDYFLILSMLPWFFTSKFYISSLSNNLPVTLFIMFIIYLTIYQYECTELEEIKFIAFLSVSFSSFALTIKLSSLPLLIATFFIFLFTCATGMKKKFNILLFRLIVIFIIIVTWVIRGVLLSGCIVYPVSITRIEGLKWAVPAQDIKEEAACARSWARLPGGSPENVLSNYKWLKPWALRLLLSPLIWPAIFLLFLGLIITFYRFQQKNDMKVNFRSCSIPMIISISGIIFWFISAPDPRFAYGYIYSFALIIFCLGLFHLNLFNFSLGKIIILSLLTVYFLNYFIYLGFSLTPSVIPESGYTICKTEEGISIYIPQKKGEAWDAPLPSTPVFKEKLKMHINDNNSPDMFYFDN